MPYKPKKPCKYQGCPNLTHDYYCDKHKGLYNRESSSKRGYDGKRRKLRKIFLQMYPLCNKCQQNGKYVEAIVLDHIQPHRNDEKLMWDESNWQSLGKPCHDKKTGKYDSLKVYKF